MIPIPPEHELAKWTTSTTTTKNNFSHFTYAEHICSQYRDWLNPHIQDLLDEELNETLTLCGKWLAETTINLIRGKRRPVLRTLSEEATYQLEQAVLRGDCISNSPSMPCILEALKSLSEYEKQSN